MNSSETPAVVAPVQQVVRPLVGCDDLRAWLLVHGFQCAPDPIGERDNACNWYAYRRSEIPARECECNERKTMQLVVTPYKYHGCGNSHAPDWQSAEVNVTGEAGGVWYKLAAYSMPHDTLREKLGEVEQSLIAAWNALRPNVKLNGTP